MYNRKEKKLIKDFIESINPELKTYYQDVFECDMYEDEIYLGKKEYTYETEMFMNWFKKEFPLCQECHWWLISLLHEIGHIETYEEEMHDNREISYAILKMAFECGDHTIEEMNIAYFQIPSEYEATYWGASYYLSNIDKCNALLSQLNVK